MKPQVATFVTVDQTKDVLGVTRAGVSWMIGQGYFPGARKLDPRKLTSAWLIPLEEVEALKKKRAQAVEA